MKNGKIWQKSTVLWKIENQTKIKDADFLSVANKGLSLQ